MSPRRYDLEHAAGAGLASGLIAGAAMSVLMTALAVSSGADPWLSAKVPAFPILGIERVFLPGFDPLAVMLGMAMHYAISAAWGLAFGALFFGFSRPATVAIGALYGVIVWATMHHVLLPLAHARDLAASVPLARAILEHVFFGVVLAVAFLPFQRALRRRVFEPLTQGR